MKKKNILKTIAIGFLCLIGINGVDAAAGPGVGVFKVINDNEVDHIYKIGDTIALKVRRGNSELDNELGKFTNDMSYIITDGLEFVSCTGNITCNQDEQTITYTGTMAGEGAITFKVVKEEDQQFEVTATYYDYHDKKEKQTDYQSFNKFYVESNDPNKSSDSSLNGIEFYYDATVNGNVINTYYNATDKYHSSSTPLIVAGGKTVQGDAFFYEYAYLDDVTLYLSSLDAIVYFGGKNEFTFKVISENRKSVTEYTLKVAKNTDNSSAGSSERYLYIDGSTSVYTFNQLFATANNIPEELRLVVKDKDKNTVDKNSKATTGMQVSFNENTYTLVVAGDLTGTGNTGIADVAKSYQHLKGKIKMDDIYVKAGDVAGNDGEIKITDVTKLYQFMKNKINTLK